MGNAAGVSQSMQSDRVIVDAILSIRPDLAGKSDSDIISHVKNDLLLAREAHESMPIGFTLKEHEGSSKESIHGKISKVGHICRVVKDADISVKFYRNIIGAELLNRPKFATNGYWLWLGNVQLHLIQSDLTVLPDHPDGGTRVNHISFDCYDFVECENRIKEAGIEYKKVYVPEGDRGINQIFFQDPDGHWIELCDCHKMNDFIFGEFDEKRCLEMSKFYNEGVELKQEFIATVLLMLLAEHDKENKNNQNSRLKELFNVFSGGDGHICIDDLSYMITRLGGKGGEESIKKLLVGIDKSGEGLISFDEFIDFLVAEVLDAPDEETIKEIFGIIDSNASGTISQTEFIDCFQALGLNIPRDQALRLFDIADVDKSKTVTLQEFGILYDIFKEEIRKHSR